MKYYIPYEPKANINYVYLLCLYGLAEYNKDTMLYDYIKYKSIRELTERIKNKFDIKVSTNTVSRFLDDIETVSYIQVNKTQKEIKLYNNFQGENKRHFVVIDDRILLFLTK